MKIKDKTPLPTKTLN